ncbi:LPS translocon maturation chaperone LptM [Pasteurellaceae bacterium 22721_9_1]
MKKLISFAILTALCGMVAACGVKGPLYFPQENNQTEQTQQK